MVRVLTDTHALVWALSDPGQLGAEARQALTQAEVFASAANLWELVLKQEKIGALLADPLSWWERYVLRSGIPTLSIRASHVVTLGHPAKVYKDPFDRILVAQSIVEDSPLISKDRQLAHYGITLIW